MKEPSVMINSSGNKTSAELASLRARVNAYASTVIERVFQSSQLPDISNDLPRFSLDEVVRGKYLGKGFFGVVYEVKGLDGRDGKGNVIRLETKKPWFQRRRNAPQDGAQEEEQQQQHNDDDENKHWSSDSDDDDEVDYVFPLVKKATAHNKQEAARDFMRRYCLRDNGQSRYAVKILRPEILNDPTKLYYQGIMDLATETRLLSNIRHPHIVKLRAIAHGTCHEDYFLILDRLSEVLEDRVKIWRIREQRNSCLLGRIILDRKGRKRHQLWQERIVAAHDLASALGYLHSRRIIHRDLKSDNIGFDIRGDIKIFDFGLARELPTKGQPNPDGAWKMTGATGTPRYMSPEVALNKPYNETSDVYSFSMLFWEVLALKIPFELYSMKGFKERVWQGPHKRPPLDPTWPEAVHLVLTRGWSPDPSERQPMVTVAEILRKEVIRCREDADDEWGLNIYTERRSTHVFDEKDLQDLSHKSLFSILSNSFQAKSPFRIKPSITATSITSPVKARKSDMDALDFTKATAAMSLSPSHVDLSEACTNEVYGSPTKRVATLPIKPPPLLDEDDGCDDFVGLQVEEGVLEKNHPPIPIGSASSIWERLEVERDRQERIRTRLSAMH